MSSDLLHGIRNRHERHIDSSDIRARGLREVDTFRSHFTYAQSTDCCSSLVAFQYLFSTFLVGYWYLFGTLPVQSPYLCTSF